MAMYGADVEALEGLANRFETHKDTMIGLIQQVTSEIESILWEGPDAETMRPDWTDRLARLVGAIDDTFGVIGAEAGHQAIEQRQASDI